MCKRCANGGSSGDDTILCEAVKEFEANKIAHLRWMDEFIEERPQTQTSTYYIHNLLRFYYSKIIKYTENRNRMNEWKMRKGGLNNLKYLQITSLYSL